MFLYCCSFNFIIIIIFVVALVCENELISNIMYEFFDLAISLYAVVIPTILVTNDKFFRKEFIRIFCKYGIMLTSRSRINSTQPYLKTVLGVKLIYDPAEEAKTYFDQLAKTWN